MEFVAALRAPSLHSCARGLAAACGLLVVLAADSRVPPASTQPRADTLLDSAGVERAAERLAASDRVTIVTIGHSAGGRPIRMLVITAPGGSLDEWRHRARAVAGAEAHYPTLTTVSTVDPSGDETSASARVPVLLAGASWGHEAAHVEGLLAAAEHLASDRSPETERVLNRLLVLIVPLMNPDGRDRAIAEWKRTPLSNGDSGVGNEDGFMLNRDFVHQTQPESAALLDVTREWRPVLGVDMHEDVNRLGLAVPATAFAPPFMRGFDVEEREVTRRAIVAVGDAIAARWRGAGYPVVHDPAGDRQWVPMPLPGSGELNPVAGSSGRLEFLWNIHGITGLITESARTPGTQTWEARVDQKKLAALAAADAVAADVPFFARAVRARRVVNHGDRTFIAVPHAQLPGADRFELLRLLRVHGVLVYRAAGHPFDVIPLGQPDADFVRHAVLAERSKLNDLASAFGVTVVPSSRLDAATRDALSSANLDLYDAPALAWPQAAVPARVGVYVGQGMDRAAAGEVQFVLKRAGVATALLDAADIRAGSFEGVGAVVFGDGAAREIIAGWDASTPTRMAPWQPSEPAKGMGTEGQAALSRFVRNGGRVVTIGRSAGLIAPALVDVELPPRRPGIGEVRLAVTPAGANLFGGTPFAPGAARAFLAAAPGGTDGGYLLKPADSRHVMAWYAGAEDRPAELSFADTGVLTRESGYAAVVSAAVGDGRVYLFGFSPVFRAQWRATFPLLINAVSGR